MRDSQDRDPYKSVGAAYRQLIDRKYAAEPPLRPMEGRVLDGILYFTLSYSKLWDDVSHEQLARVIGLDIAKKSLRDNLRETLKQLQGRGLITYEPSSTRGKPSRIGIPPAEVEPPAAGGANAIRPPADGCNRPPADGGTPEKTRESAGSAPADFAHAREGREPPSPMLSPELLDDQPHHDQAA